MDCAFVLIFYIYLGVADANSRKYHEKDNDEKIAFRNVLYDEEDRERKPNERIKHHTAEG